MGNNLPAKIYSKKTPTQLRLCFEMNGNNDTRYIDVARALSVINRRAYRQGLYYYINSVELHNDENSVVDLLCANDNWITQQAWLKGFEKFQKMNSMVETPRPKYHDFKVLLTDQMTEANIMDPDTYNRSMVHQSNPPDEWIYSKFTTMRSDGGQADEWTAHLVGVHDGAEGNWNSIGLIRSYANTRTQPPSIGEPNVDSSMREDPMANLFDASGDHALKDIMKNLDEHNDVAPYDASTYIGEGSSQLAQVARLATVATVNRVSVASGFCAPMGLIAIKPQETSTGFSIVLNIAAGTYHGVYAERV